MVDTRKLLLRYLIVLQVYQGSHLVHSNQDADAASIPAKLCLPYDKSELERYLKKLDTPEVSVSNSGSSLSVKDTESLPFGALPMDWRRLRLLSDISTVPKPEIEKISSDKDFTGVSEGEGEGEEAFLTTGNIRVPDEKRGTTIHVRLHRSTLNNRNGNIDSTMTTVEPDTFDGWEEEEVPSVTESGTDVDIEENSGLTGIPMFEEVEKSTELITTDSNLTTTPLTTVLNNTDSLIEELVTTEEIKPDVTISVSSKNYEDESFSSTTESPAETDIGTTKMTVILKIGEPFSSVPKFVEHYGDREANKNRVSRVRNFGKSWDRHSQNRIDSGEDEALAKTRLSVFEPFDLGKKLRSRRPNSRRGKEGLVKRGGHNTNTEKLFRWFYRGDRNPDNSGKLNAEIKCIERS